MKRRRPLLNRTPLRGKPRPVRPATQLDYTPRPRPIAQAVGEIPMAEPQPKQQPWRSEPYRRLVAADPCEHCGVHGYSQAAHADQGKGMGTKTGDDTCYALCGTHLQELDGGMVPGCHEIIGRRLTREQRRPLEAFYAKRTRDRHRARCEAMGINLPAETS